MARHELAMRPQQGPWPAAAHLGCEDGGPGGPLLASEVQHKGLQGGVPAGQRHIQVQRRARRDDWLRSQGAGDAVGLQFQAEGLALLTQQLRQHKVKLPCSSREHLAQRHQRRGRQTLTQTALCQGPAPAHVGAADHVCTAMRAPSSSAGGPLAAAVSVGVSPKRSNK